MAIVRKTLIKNQPNYGDNSVYNFSDVNYSGEYTESSGLPVHYDKFQKKDLYTKAVGTELNEKIIEKNLKFVGDNFITINNLYISNTGVDGTVKNNYCHIWMFTEKAYKAEGGNNPLTDSFNALNSVLYSNTKFRIYAKSGAERSEGQDWGNLSDIENIPVINDFSNISPSIDIGANDFPGGDNFLPRGTDGDDSDGDGSPDYNMGGAFEMDSTDVLDSQMQKLFNEEAINPLYIVVRLTGDKKVAWPINTDTRDTKFSVYRFSNKELFFQSGNVTSGKVSVFNLNSPDMERTAGGAKGARQAAWRISQLRLTISTIAGAQNDFNTTLYDQYITEVLPPLPIYLSQLYSIDFLSYLHPANQLNNLGESGGDEALERHPNYTPIINFALSDANNTLFNVDLQSYHEGDIISSFKASAPAEVGFSLLINKEDFEYKDINTNNYLNQLSTVDSLSGDYFYCVLDWNDTENKINTVDDYLRFKPDNPIEYIKKQEQDLFVVKRLKINDDGEVDLFKSDPNTLKHIYSNPGIKTVKILIISCNADEVRDNQGVIIKEANQIEVGRWKIVTSRFYLDIPINQYPDFGELGGADFATIPWPYTTPIIGGTDETSKYKISVQDTLSSGNIGDTDIIDERFLINDIENDETGKSILSFDLEQVRYFNSSYDMNKLLGIDEVVDQTVYGSDSSEYLATLPFPQYFEEFKLETNWGPDKIVVQDAFHWRFTANRDDIATYIEEMIEETDDNFVPEYGNGSEEHWSFFWNPGGSITISETVVNNQYTDISGSLSETSGYWDGSTVSTTFPMESSVGQIFINDNIDTELKQNCQIELNTGNLTGKSIYDSSGKSNKGLLIGDYKVKKSREGEPMRRDSFIKIPSKASNKGGAM